MAASLPPEQLRRLQDAAKAFLEKRDYGCIQVEAVMEDIFGDRAARLANPVGCEWTKYWTALEDYEQRQRDADYDPDSPPELPAMPGSTITSAGTVNAPKTREAAPLTLKLPATGKKRKAENQEDGGGPKKKPGPKPNELLDRISIAGIDDTKTTQNKHTWRCIAPACSYKRQGRRLVAEVAAHAARCTLLRAHDEDAWQDAVDSQVDKALGAVLNLADHSSKESEPTADKRRPGRPKAIAVPDSNQPSLNLDPFRAAGLKKTAEQKDTFQRTIDHKIMVLICKCGLVPDLLDRQEWADLVHFLNPTYTPTPAKKFTHEYIPQEAALVRQRTKEVLRSSRNLTYTFDGTSIRRGDSFYTAHACTPKREIYFLGGHFGSKESHNAEWIKDGAVETMRDIGSELWGAAASDSTSVTLAARRGMTEELQALLDLCDVVHFGQHLIGDVNELPEFKAMMEIMKPLLRHFSKSSQSKAHLKDSGIRRAEDGSDEPIHMLAKIGRTRFATHYMAATTIEPVLRNIQDLVLEKKITFKSKKLQAVFGSRYSLEFPTFAKDLLTYHSAISCFPDTAPSRPA
ncbi:hypothetical protein C8R45DRAFT_1094896 [Mycena sanguinolenta]|nr:hypothetical protein C8R45DRAFT_1094896 [Mycena sanguinolenta]